MFFLIIYNSFSILKTEPNENLDIEKEPTINLDMLPDFIDLAAAENIIFTGLTIAQFDKCDKKGPALPQEPILKEKEADYLKKISNFTQKDGINIRDLLDFTESIRMCVSEVGGC